MNFYPSLLLNGFDFRKKMKGGYWIMIFVLYLGLLQDFFSFHTELFCYSEAASCLSMRVHFVAAHNV